MPQEITKLMSEFAAETDSDRRFELIQTLYTILAEQGESDPGIGPLEFMARQGHW